MNLEDHPRYPKRDGDLKSNKLYFYGTNQKYYNTKTIDMRIVFFRVYGQHKSIVVTNIELSFTQNDVAGPALALCQNLSTIFSYQNGVLKLCRQTTIFCNNCPIVIPYYSIYATNCQHRLCTAQSKVTFNTVKSCMQSWSNNFKLQKVTDASSTTKLELVIT